MKAPPSPRPSLRFMLSHPAHLMALGFGSGLSPWAPGTAGTLWAWAIFSLLSPGLSALHWGWILIAGLAAGWWSCTITARHLNQSDPSAIVWDEIIAFWAVLWLVTPADGWTQLTAFVLFRFFDAVKPGPVAWADRLFKLNPGASAGPAQGFGIIWDDLVAAACTLLVMAVWRVLVGMGGGA